MREYLLLPGNFQPEMACTWHNLTLIIKMTQIVFNFMAYSEFDLFIRPNILPFSPH
jgi:hypothetical protein